MRATRSSAGSLPHQARRGTGSTATDAQRYCRGLLGRAQGMAGEARKGDRHGGPTGGRPGALGRLGRAGSEGGRGAKFASAGSYLTMPEGRLSLSMTNAMRLTLKSAKKSRTSLSVALNGSPFILTTLEECRAPPPPYPLPLDPIADDGRGTRPADPEIKDPVPGLRSRSLPDASSAQITRPWLVARRPSSLTLDGERSATGKPALRALAGGTLPTLLGSAARGYERDRGCGAEQQTRPITEA